MKCLKPILYVVAIITILIIAAKNFFNFNLFGKQQAIVKKNLLTPQQVVEYTHAIANDLGTGWNFTIDEYDDSAGRLLAELNQLNFKAVKESYKIFFGRDLIKDAQKLLDEDTKLFYQSQLNANGIF